MRNLNNKCRLKYLINLVVIILTLLGVEYIFIPIPQIYAKNDFILEGTVLIQYLGSDSTVIVPEGVKEIGASAFFHKEKMSVIKLPSFLEKIGEEAFLGCINLEKIELPESVTSIGKFAFQECSKLSSIKLPDGITTIEEGSFGWCRNLTRVRLPENLITIEKSAFFGTPIFEINLPHKLKFIGEEAFLGNRNMTELYIPANVKKIGQMAFSFSRHLIKFQVEDSNQNYSSLNGLLYNKDKSILIQCPNMIESVLISSKTKIIASQAFDGCRMIKKIVIPKGVKRIEKGAFTCENLTSITIPSSVIYIDKSAFLYKELVIFSEEGSYASSYAKKNGSQFRCIIK